MCRWLSMEKREGEREREGVKIWSICEWIFCAFTVHFNDSNMSSVVFLQKLMSVIIYFIEFQNFNSEREKWNLNTPAIERKFIEYFLLNSSTTNEIENRVYFLRSCLLLFLFLFLCTASMTFLFVLANRHGMCVCVCCVRTTTASTKICRFANVFRTTL